MSRSKIAGLPADIREQLEDRLAEQGCRDIRGTTDWLNGLLEAAELDPVSKSAVHRFGQEFEDKVEDIRRHTEMARVLLRRVDDQEGALNDSAQRALTTKLVRVIDAMDIDPDDNDSVARMQKVADAIAKLGKASVDQKKWQDQVREKTAAAAAAAEQLLQKDATVPPEKMRALKELFLGITR